MLVVNLYPFEATVARPTARWRTRLKTSTSAVRRWYAAQRKLGDVVVLTDESIRRSTERTPKPTNAVSDATKVQMLRRCAFNRIAQYDAAISNYLSSIDPQTRDVAARAEYPEQTQRQYGPKYKTCAYGENSHQTAALSTAISTRTWLLVTAQQLQGKNFVQQHRHADAAWECIKSFDIAACTSSSNANPCGASGWCEQLGSLQQSLEPTRPPFRRIIAFNTVCDGKTTEAVSSKQQFVEVLIAPEYTPGDLHF